jgi:hypothetical protein
MFYDRQIAHALERIERKVDLILKRESLLMAAIDDLKAAVAALASAVTDGITEIEALLAKISNPASTDADVAAAAAQIASITQSIKDEVAKAMAAAP